MSRDILEFASPRPATDRPPAIKHKPRPRVRLIRDSRDLIMPAKVIKAYLDAWDRDLDTHCDRILSYVLDRRVVYGMIGSTLGYRRGALVPMIHIEICRVTGEIYEGVPTVVEM